LAIWGPSGTGKTHVCEALGAAVIEKGMRVAWFTLESLTAAIGRAKVDASVQRVVTRICRADFIVIDDIGMLPSGQEAAEAFYKGHRRRLREAQCGADQQPPPLRLRHHHAQDAGYRGGRSLPPPRPHGQHRRGVHPPRRGSRRQGGEASGLSSARWGEILSAYGEFWCPPVGRFRVRLWGVPV